MTTPRTVPRRAVLQAGAAVGATLAAPTAAGAAAAAPRADSAVIPLRPRGTVEGESASPYSQHRAPLRPAPFLPLPAGSVRPHGWLRQQLDLQVDGLTGHYDDVSPYLQIDDNGWVDPEKTNGAWEELPYWLRGFSELGWATGDADVIERASAWIRKIMATRTDDGWFGPTSLRTSLEGGPDLWPGMPLLATLRSWHEHSGDDAVIELMTGYFRFQSTQPDEVFNRSWGAQRWGDTIDSIYWLYDRTGDAWLLDLVHRIHAGMADYTSGMPNWHNVNISQGFREPLQYWLLSGKQKHHDATYDRYDEIIGGFGQFPGGGFAGDENVRPGYTDPRQGFEVCGVVELMRSHELLTRETGDPVWADRCERLAFDSLPVSYDKQARAIHYVNSANAPRLRPHSGVADEQMDPDGDDISIRGQAYGQFDNDWNMQSYMTGIHNFRCCPHNYGQGWPYFSRETWLSSHDGGLVASLYAPTTVTAKVVGDVEVTIEERTSYPFDETVELQIMPKQEVAFPLHLRIPAWCAAPELEVAGERVRVEGSGPGYVRIERTWRPGDVVRLVLPMPTTVTSWTAQHDAVSVQHGPLTFSLDIGQEWSRYAGSEDWPQLAVAPTTPWNYGLDLPEDRPERRIEVRRRRVPEGSDPFDRESTPLVATAPARLVPGWREDVSGVVGVLQPGPALSRAPRVTVDLVPMGAAHLRMTVLPRVARDRSARPWAAPSASWCFGQDDVAVIAAGAEPASSRGEDLARMTFWPHLGTREWVQYDFDQEVLVSESEVYWFDDAGDCRVPAGWRLCARRDGAWVPVSRPSGYGLEKDTFNRVRFSSVRTDALRLEVTLRPGRSTGILAWRHDAR